MHAEPGEAAHASGPSEREDDSISKSASAAEGLPLGVAAAAGCGGTAEEIMRESATPGSPRLSWASLRAPDTPLREMHATQQRGGCSGTGASFPQAQREATEGHREEAAEQREEEAAWAPVTPQKRPARGSRSYADVTPPAPPLKAPKCESTPDPSPPVLQACFLQPPQTLKPPNASSAASSSHALPFPATPVPCANHAQPDCASAGATAAAAAAGIHASTMQQGPVAPLTPQPKSKGESEAEQSAAAAEPLSLRSSFREAERAHRWAQSIAQSIAGVLADVNENRQRLVKALAEANQAVAAAGAAPAPSGGTFSADLLGAQQGARVHALVDNAADGLAMDEAPKPEPKLEIKEEPGADPLGAVAALELPPPKPEPKFEVKEEPGAGQQAAVPAFRPPPRSGNSLMNKVRAKRALREQAQAPVPDVSEGLGLNEKQAAVFNKVMAVVGAFPPWHSEPTYMHVSGGFGTGKTHLLRLLAQAVSAAGQKYLCTAFSAKAAMRLPGGRTASMAFGLSTTAAEAEMSQTQTQPTVEDLGDLALVVTDEGHLLWKDELDAIGEALRNGGFRGVWVIATNPHSLLRVVIGTPLDPDARADCIVPRSFRRADCVRAGIKTHLTQQMRITDTELARGVEDIATAANHIITGYDSSGSRMDVMLPNGLRRLHAAEDVEEWVCAARTSRPPYAVCVLCGRNAQVDAWNKRFLELFCEERDVAPVRCVGGCELAVGAPVILTANVRPAFGLCTNALAEVVEISPRGDSVRVKVAEALGQQSCFTLHPRALKTDAGGRSRMHIPVRLAYSMTVHRAANCLFDRVVVDLTHDFWDHGQLPTALSRVSRAEDMCVMHGEHAPPWAEASAASVVFAGILRDY